MPYATSGGHNPSRRSAQAAVESIQTTRSGQRFQIPQERTAASRVANYNRESLTNRYQGYAALRQSPNNAANILSNYNRETLTNRYQGYAASRESPRHVNNIMNNARQRSMQDYYERLNKINNM